MNLQIAIHGKNDPVPIWPDMGQPVQGTITHCAILQAGMESGKSSISFNVAALGRNVFVELSADMLHMIMGALEGAENRWDEMERGKTASSAPTPTVHVDSSIPEISKISEVPSLPETEPPLKPQESPPHESKNRPTPAARSPRQQPKRARPQAPIPPNPPADAA